MDPVLEYQLLVEAIGRIETYTAALNLSADERSMLALGCLDVALEYQAAIAILHSASLHGSPLALLRVLAESVVRGLWLAHCATDEELRKFREGKVDSTFAQLVERFEGAIGTPEGILTI